MSATVITEHGPGQSLLAEQLIVSPYTPSWWTAQVITDIPNDAVGWLVAQGWQITDVEYDETHKPKVPYYTMARESLQNWIILQSLLDHYVMAHNDATTQNAIRYNDIVQSWDGMLDNSQDYFSTQADERNAQALLFLGNLDSYMDKVDTLIGEGEDKFADLETDYDVHDANAQGYLTDLGATELARINEHFDATRAVQVQQLIDKGIYNSAVAVDITARNERDRDEQIQSLNDRLNREKLDNDHKLYEQKLTMRKTLADSKHQAVVEKMNAAAARLSGLSQQQAENLKLMQYFLDERNKLLIGLYSVVERRSDVYPSFSDLVNLTT
ncbi:MAG: hypothetical protein KJ556_20895, partial [Gammaproteobacteria bacterium]|nr:hypothetical protein [Gammaproteobacteria bacterium]